MRQTHAEIETEYQSVLDQYERHLKFLDESESLIKDIRYGSPEALVNAARTTKPEDQRTMPTWRGVTARSEAIKAEERKERRDRIKAKVMGKPGR